MSDTPQFIGPYEVLAQLGRGGMGIVYRARHRELGREVALKVIAHDATGSSSAAALTGATDGAAALRERFRREAQAAGRLAGHPNIVAVHDVGEFQTVGLESHTRLYLVMDLVEGRSLDELIDEGELTVQESARLLAQVARAAAHAHDAGVLHRDIKPGNVLVAADGTARLTDFGLARPTRADPEITRLTQAGEMLGTPAYMAPEQARGAGLDGRADVYALGATLYDLLCGRPPFAADSTLKVLSSLMRDRPEPPRVHRPGIPVDLQTIALACLEKEPDDRYQTASALADDLEAFLAGRPIARRAPGAASRGARIVRRHPVAVALGVVALGSVVVGGWLWNRSHAIDAQGESQLEAARLSGSAAERAGAAAARLYALARATNASMRVLEDYWHGASVTRDARHAAAAELRTHLADATPALSAAWRAVGRQFLSEHDTADALITQATETAGEDPFPLLIAARAALVRYVHLAERPKVSYSKDLVVDEFRPSEAMRLLLAQVDTALRAAEASPLWPHIRQGREYRDYVLAAQAFGRGEWITAAEQCDGLAHEEAIGPEAAMLAGLAWYVARDYPKAAASWERAGRRGWPHAYRYAGDAWDSHATVLRSKGQDPLPPLEQADAAYERGAAVAGVPSPLLVLQGNTRHRRANLTLERGGDALPLLASAVAIFTRVAEMQTSDLSVAHSNRANAHLLAGAILRRRGEDPRPRWRLAEADYEQAIALAGEDPWPLGKRAALYARMASYLDERNEDPEPWYERCVSDCNALLAIYPDTARVRLKRLAALIPLGELRNGRGDVAGATRALEQAVADGRVATRRMARDHEAHVGLATALTAIAHQLSGAGGDPAPIFAEAFAAYATATKLRPGSAAIHLHAARAHRTFAGLLPPREPTALAQIDRAIVQAHEAIAANGTLFDARRELMRAHAARIKLLIHRRADVTPDWVAMQRTFPPMDSLAPSHGRPLLDVAKACEEIVDLGAPRGLAPEQFFKAGIKAATIVTQRSPEWSPGWSTRGDLYQRWGEIAQRRGGPAIERYHQAIADFTESLERDGTRWAVWTNRANAHQSLGEIATKAGADPTAQFEAAIADYSAALKRRDDLWQAWLGRGVTHAKLTHTAQAIADLERGLALGPDAPHFRAMLDELKSR